jgi:hypothetical protein
VVVALLMQTLVLLARLRVVLPLDLQNHDRRPVLLEQAPLPPLRTLCRRLAYRLHRALAVLPLISVQRF